MTTAEEVGAFVGDERKPTVSSWYRGYFSWYLQRKITEFREQT